MQCHTCHHFQISRVTLHCTLKLNNARLLLTVLNSTERGLKGLKEGLPSGHVVCKVTQSNSCSCCLSQEIQIANQFSVVSLSGRDWYKPVCCTNLQRLLIGLFHVMAVMHADNC